MVLYFYICLLACLHFISFLVDFSILRVPSICQPCSFYDFICCHCHRTIVLRVLSSFLPLPDSTIVLFFANVVVSLFLFVIWPPFRFQRTFAAKQKRESDERGVASSVGETVLLSLATKLHTSCPALLPTGQCTLPLCIAIKVTL